MAYQDMDRVCVSSPRVSKGFEPTTPSVVGLLTRSASRLIYIIGRPITPDALSDARQLERLIEEDI